MASEAQLLRWPLEHHDILARTAVLRAWFGVSLAFEKDLKGNLYKVWNSDVVGLVSSAARAARRDTEGQRLRAPTAAQYCYPYDTGCYDDWGNSIPCYD